MSTIEDMASELMMTGAMHSLMILFRTYLTYSGASGHSASGCTDWRRAGAAG